MNKIKDFIFDKLLDSIWSLLCSVGLVSLLVAFINNILLLQIFSVSSSIFLILVLYICFKFHKEKKQLLFEINNLNTKLDEKIINHDKKIFEESNDMMPEQKFLDLIQWQLWNGWHRNEDFTPVDKFIDFFNLTSNCYLNEKIKIKLNKLFENLKQLTSFVGTHFFYLPHCEIYKLYPEIREFSEEENFLLEKLKELQDIINEVEVNYKKYRESVKEELLI